MEQAVDKLLDDRAEWLKRQGRTSSVTLSLALHAVLALSWIVVPLLASGDDEPLEFVPVQLVPVQALGVKDPSPTRSTRTPETEPVPAAVEEPKKEEKVEAKTEPPALPAPNARKKKRPSAPAPSRPSSSSARDAGPARRKGSALGSSTGSSAFGATVGGLDNPDFVYGYYVDQMLSMIGSNWVRPALGAEVEAAIHFRIARDGSLSELRVLRSSGYNSFDLAGLRAVRLAAPLPRLPQSYPHDSLGVTLILR